MRAKKIDKRDIERFTLPSPKEEVVITEEKKENEPPVLLSDSDEGNSFWQRNTGKIWMSVFMLIIVTALIIGLTIFSRGTAKSNLNNQSTATVIPTPLPSIILTPPPTSTPVASDTTQYKIEVLNGNGVEGNAAKVQIILEAAGFNISSIGNGDRKDYQKTIIQAKKTVSKDFLDKLKSFLEKTYVVDDIKELKESEEFNIILVIGSQKS